MPLADRDASSKYACRACEEAPVQAPAPERLIKGGLPTEAMVAYVLVAKSVPVKETHGGATVWEGVVHVFDIAGHPKATRAYAWSSPIEGSDKRRFFAVLHLPPITSPADAVCVAEAAPQSA